MGGRPIHQFAGWESDFARWPLWNTDTRSGVSSANSTRRHALCPICRLSLCSGSGEMKEQEHETPINLSVWMGTGDHHRYFERNRVWKYPDPNHAGGAYANVRAGCHGTTCHGERPRQLNV